MIVQVFSECNKETYKVDLSIGFDTRYGYFTEKNDESFKFRHLMNLTHEQARSVAGLGNSLYEMGYAQAKRDIARKLGLLDSL